MADPNSTIISNNRTVSEVKRDISGLQEELTKEKAYEEIYHLFHDKFEFSVKVYFPLQFEALRKMYCGSYNDFLHSIFRSDLWEDNSGGKS